MRIRRGNRKELKGERDRGIVIRESFFLNMVPKHDCHSSIKVGKDNYVHKSFELMNSDGQTNIDKIRVTAHLILQRKSNNYM